MKQGWEYKKLGEVCDIINGKNQRAVENPKGIYPIMGSGGIIGYADDYLCNEGTTIIGRKGSINKPIYVNQKFWNVDTAFGLQPKEGTESRFLFYLCKSINFERYNKSVTIPSLVKSDLLKIDIHIPYFSVQKQIASELDLLSGVIEKQKAQLEELDKLAQSIFYDMFGDPVTNEKGWEYISLGNVVEISSKLVDPNEEPYSNQYHVSPANIISGTGEIIDCRLAKDECLISGKYAFKKGAVLYSKIRPNLNKVAIPNFDGICSADMYPLTVKDRAINLYIQKLLSSKEFLKYAINCSGRARMPKINREALFQFNFCCPPLSLQQEFAAKVEAIEAMKAKVRQSLKEAETLFNSRMDYYFN